MAFQFPWTNLHELNLDWFLSKFKQFTDNYLGTTATAESVPNGTPPSVTVTGGDLDDDTDIVDPFTFNFKIPAGAQGEQGVQGVPGQDGFSPIATVTKTGTVATITITDANGTTTTTISDGEVTQAQLDTKAPAIMSSATGLIANFSDGADNMPMSELMVSITPFQSGSGDPAPDNIRPISGWTGCNVTRTGKNLCDTNDMVAGILNASGVVDVQNVTITSKGNGSVAWESTSTWRGVTTGFIDVRENNVYRISLAETVSYVLYAWYDRNKNFISRASFSGNNMQGVTAPSNAFYVRFTFQQSAVGTYTYTNIQLELGSTATAYEPYIAPTTVSLSWQNEAGTVYGGTIDVATGLLTVDRAIVDLGTLTWSYASSGQGRVQSNGLVSSIKPASAQSVVGNIVCDTYKTVSANAVYSGTVGIAVNDNGYLWVHDSNYTDGATFETAISGHYLAYEVATPQTYQLTPQQLFNTLYGVNNVWSDTGDSTVTYTADTKLYIEQLTQPTEDDIIANTSIANGKFFMIGNNLYRATTAIASGSQIIPGTNATHMSLADALNLL